MGLSIQQSSGGVREMTISIFDAYLNDVIAMSGTMITYGKYFALIGVLVKITKQYLDPSTRSEPWGYFSWIILAFFLIRYSQFVSGIFSIYDSIESSLKQTNISWDTAFKELEFAVIQNMNPSFFSMETFNSFVDKGIAETLYNHFKMRILTQIIIVMVLFIKTVSTVVFIGVKAYSVIYLMILVVFGPINIGLSFIPAMNDMWKGWLQKMLNVLMWIPMLFLIDAFMLGLIDKLYQSLLTKEVDMGMVFGATILSGMAVFMYLKAPSLSNFIVQGSQVGKLSMGSQTGNAATKAANLTKKAASLYTGIPMGGK